MAVPELQASADNDTDVSSGWSVTLFARHASCSQNGKMSAGTPITLGSLNCLWNEYNFLRIVFGYCGSWTHSRKPGHCPASDKLHSSITSHQYAIPLQHSTTRKHSAPLTQRSQSLFSDIFINKHVFIVFPWVFSDTFLLWQRVWWKTACCSGRTRQWKDLFSILCGSWWCIESTALDSKPT